MGTTILTLYSSKISVHQETKINSELLKKNFYLKLGKT